MQKAQLHDYDNRPWYTKLDPENTRLLGTLVLHLLEDTTTFSSAPQSLVVLEA